MNKRLFFIISVMAIPFLGLAVNADPMPVSPAQTPTYATYQSCIRQYQLPYEKVYYLALGAVNSAKFNILEMQSRSGYILFEADKKEFLLSVMKKDNKTTFVKITPADNNYAFSPTIPQRVFSQIDLAFTTPIQEIK